MVRIMVMVSVRIMVMVSVRVMVMVSVMVMVRTSFRHFMVSSLRQRRSRESWYSQPVAASGDEFDPFALSNLRVSALTFQESRTAFSQMISKPVIFTYTVVAGPITQVPGDLGILRR